MGWLKKNSKGLVLLALACAFGYASHHAAVATLGAAKAFYTLWLGLFSLDTAIASIVLFGLAIGQLELTE